MRASASRSPEFDPRAGRYLTTLSPGVRLRICDVFDFWVTHHYNDVTENPSMARTLQDFITITLQVAAVYLAACAVSCVQLTELWGLGRRMATRRRRRDCKWRWSAPSTAHAAANGS